MHGVIKLLRRRRGSCRSFGHNDSIRASELTWTGSWDAEGESVAIDDQHDAVVWDH